MADLQFDEEDSRAKFVNRRRGRYMAQILDAFETDIEPHLPRDAAGAVQDFKGKVRARVTALANDANEIYLMGGEQNGAAQDLRDSLSATGRP